MHYYNNALLKGKEIEVNVKKCAEVVQKHFPETKTIVGVGMSGASVAYPLAVALNLNVSMCRGRGVVSHGSTFTNVFVSPVLFVDDFISTGDTVRLFIQNFKSFREHMLGTPRTQWFPEEHKLAASKKALKTINFLLYDAKSTPSGLKKVEEIASAMPDDFHWKCWCSK